MEHNGTIPHDWGAPGCSSATRSKTWRGGFAVGDGTGWRPCLHPNHQVSYNLYSIFLGEGCPGIVDSPESLYFSICIMFFFAEHAPFLPILSANRFLGSSPFVCAQLRWLSFVAVICCPHPRGIETPKREKQWFIIIWLDVTFVSFWGLLWAQILHNHSRYMMLRDVPVIPQFFSVNIPRMAMGQNSTPLPKVECVPANTTKQNTSSVP